MTNQEIGRFNFFSPGLPLLGTEIKFRRVASTNQPLGAIALIGLGVIGFVKRRF